MQDAKKNLEAVAQTIGSLAPAFHALEELAARFGADPRNVDLEIRANQRRILSQAAQADLEAAKRWQQRPQNRP